MSTLNESLQKVQNLINRYNAAVDVWEVLKVQAMEADMTQTIVKGATDAPHELVMQILQGIHTAKTAYAQVTFELIDIVSVMRLLGIQYDCDFLFPKPQKKADGSMSVEFDIFSIQAFPRLQLSNVKVAA